uniref:KTSC domain-containing protein n=1 Tax=Mammaliicoccus phage MSShimriz1 TaxID=3230127 RepID=A0AAU8GT39_9VIRU
MNIKEVTVRLAMIIQEMDTEVYNMVIRDRKDKTKLSSITLNQVVTFSFIEADENPKYTVKFMGEYVYVGYSLSPVLRQAVKYAQEYADNRAHYNKYRNSI